jgi:phosphopantetheinyl transferase
LCHADSAQSLDASVLSTEEERRYKQRRGALLGRTFLRHLLSRYAEEGAGEWRFENGRHGKPALVSPSRPLQFNLSHSGHWLAAAVSGHAQLGVDVQEVDLERPVHRLARRYYSAAEQADLESREGGDYYRHFYHLWSLKEAWTKAGGGALPTALGATGFQIQDRELISLVPEKTGSSSFWLLELEGYSLALCSLETGLRLSCRRWAGEGSGEPLELARVAVAGAL